MNPEALVAQARAGNIDAFGRLVELSGPTCYRLCYAILRSHPDAEDAAQEAFLNAWRQLPKLRNTAAWPEWMRRIAVRSALDISRRRSRRIGAVREARFEDDFADVVATRSDIESAFLRLSADDRSVLVLRFYLDLQVPQIAALFGIPVATAKTRLYRATERLRDEMERSGGS